MYHAGKGRDDESHWYLHTLYGLQLSISKC